MIIRRTQKGPTRRIVITTMASAMAAGAGATAYAQMHGGGMHMHGADGTGHDEVHMPGLRGLDASAEESNEIAIMFQNFPMIERDVELLSDGIRTRTYSADPDLMGVIVSHVTGMINRVEEGRDPKILIQSPTLDILFARNATLVSEIEIADDGIIVVQTSDNAEVVAALQTHADEVTDMADRGMMAVHEMMMKRAGNNG